MLVSTIGVISINAQELHLGVKGGLNVAYVNGYEEFAGDDLRLGHQFGIYGDIIFSEKLSLQIEALYSTQGASYEDSEDFDGGEIINYTDDELKLNYIIVPVLLKFYLTKGLNLQAGPQIGFLLDAVNAYNENGVPVEIDLEELAESTDFGLAFGIGYKMDFGLNIDLRYIHGVSNILSDNIGFDEKLNNQVVQLSVGYSILH